ncbi:MAG: hypothetical protein HQM14_11070 [SAR324 cluster bacterium]|nr:hypothetical protein [SAR324 cluster bacterium]
MLQNLKTKKIHEHLQAAENSMSSEQCRRRNKRVIGAVQVVYEGTKIVAYNVSTSGIAFNTTKNFNKKIGKTIPLTIVIPDHPKSSKKKKLKLEAEVKYSRFDDTWKSHIVGLEYIKYAKNDKKRIKQLVHSLDHMNLYFGERYFDYTRANDFSNL